MKFAVTITVVAWTILISYSLGQDDYDAEVLRSAKGEAEPYPPSPPPPPNPEEIPATEGPPTETCPNPDVEKEGNDEDEFGAYLANFYAEESPNSDRVTMPVKSSCSNLPPNMANTLTHVGLPQGKCITLFEKPNCAGNTVDFHFTLLSFHLKHANWDNKAKSFRSMLCDVPCKDRPEEEGESYDATFYAEESTHSEHVTLPVKPSCSDVPPNLANTLTTIALPHGKCLTLYNKPNCCGNTVAYHFTHLPFHLKNSNWNDKGKSFHSRPCEYPEEQKPEKESFEVLFYEAIERKGWDSIALDASSCCTNVPTKRTGHPGNSPWNEAVSDLDLPEGKCIRIFDNPNCEGEKLDVAHNGQPKPIVDAGWDNRPKSFKALPCGEVAT